MRLLGKEEIVKQSERAYERWKEIWHSNAKDNTGKYYKENPEIRNSKQGKSCIIAAFGPSLKKNVEIIKKANLHYQYDIVAVDKTVKTFLDKDIVPNYLIVSDAQVSFEKYGNIDPKYCKRIKLIMAVTANSKWAKHWIENGGQVYYYVNKDNIRTHKIFGEYLKNKQSLLIPASSNVGNCAYVMASLILGYKKCVLVGYDYSYSLLGSYYGDGDKKPIDTNLKINKHNLYNHNTVLDINREPVQVSSNMLFSSKWLIDFIKTMERRVLTINATGSGILFINNQANLVA